MGIYKIKISKDEINFEWVIVNTWFNPVKVIWNPTENDLKCAIEPKSYSKTNICNRCRDENNITDKSILYPKNARHESGKISNRYICQRHYFKDQQRLPNSQNNILRSITNRRTGNLTDQRSIFSDNCEELTCRWRKLKNLNIENDNYRSTIDHSKDKVLGIIQTKGAHLTGINEVWQFGYNETEHKKQYDNMILYCMSKDGLFVERVYIIPKKEIDIRKHITITKNPSKNYFQWFNKYMFTDKEEIKKINKIWKEILEGRPLGKDI